MTTRFLQLASFAVVIVTAALARAAATKREVIYTSDCSCDNDHGVARWRAKTDPSEPPADPKSIQPITPSEMFSWIGPGIIPRGGGRTGNELRWFALTGRVISMAAETDGDVHVVLADATGEQPGRVVIEMPLGARWCAMRTIAFSWTNAVFPFIADWQNSPFRLVKHPLVTVIGKAFYDTDHSGKDIRNNRRPRDKDKAVWEIHPVMKLAVIEENGAAVPAAQPPATPAPPPPGAATAPPAAASPVPGQQLVTITQPVRIRIPYGETTIPAGTKLPLVERDATNARVRYLGEVRTIPVSSTDLP